VAILCLYYWCKNTLLYWCKNTRLLLIFNFTLACRSPVLTGNHYSEYQLFLYQTITEHREQGMTFDAIAEWLNNEGYLTVRGKEFRSAHVHSILKKRLAKEELLNREYPAVWCIHVHSTSRQS
jgi:hypothetical protein